MNDTNKTKNFSPLVQSVMALDEHFQNLIRISEKIEENDLKTDNDIEQARKLMSHFANTSDSISGGITELANRLNEARASAEAAAEKVGAKATQIQSRDGAEASKIESFRLLAEKVGAINQSLVSIKPQEGQEITDADREATMNAFREVDRQLQPLIDEAEAIRDDAQKLKMKGLEQQASSLTQHLINVKQKIAFVVGQTH